MTDLYRFFDADGQLLYVGITDRGPRRWREHMRSKPWWDEVATIKLEKHRTRRSAQTAEVSAIRREQPLHNVAHSRRTAPRPEPAPAVSEWEPLPVEVRTACDCRDCLRTIRQVLRNYPGGCPVVVKFFDCPIPDAGAPPVVRHPGLFGELKSAELHRTPDESASFRNLMLTLNEFPEVLGGTVEQYKSALTRAGFSVRNPGLLKAAVESIRRRVSA